MSARKSHFRPAPAKAPPEADRAPLLRDLHGAFRSDRLGLPGASSPLDPILEDHLFAAPPGPTLSPGRPSTTPSGPGVRASVQETGVRVRSSVPPSSPSAVALPDLLPVGSIIDKYRLEELLGTGGFGAVYRATHLLLQKTVALKLLRSNTLRGRPDLATLLCEEARFAARISHPNVVQVFDVTHTPAITYVVMEHVEGTTLGRTLKRGGALPQLRAVEIAIDVLRGLAAALDQGLIHRDIKPQNIILTARGAAKILDLGLAHSMVDRQSPPGADSRRASVVGTYGYMAPEQLVDPEAVDFRADVYSLGVTLYEAVTGASPFPATSARASAELHRKAPVPPPEGLVPDISPSLSRILLWMLEKVPERRPASYAILEQALENTRSML